MNRSQTNEVTKAFQAIVSELPEGETLEYTTTVEVDGETREETVTTNQVVKPIALAKVINRPPQMVYTYVKKGYLASGQDSNGKVILPAPPTLEWVLSFLTRQEERAQRRQEAVEAELAGESTNA